MIQRIQSVFLLLTSVTFFLQFVFNFATSDQSIPKLLSDKIYNIMDHPILIGLTVIGGALALINIFLFRNRPLQVRLGYLLIILCILLPVVAMLLMLTEGAALTDGQEINESVGIALPIIGLITTVLANKYINRDNKIVQSMDRLR